MGGARARIAWDKVRERLRESQLALERASVEDPQRVERIYRERAARLARRPASVSFSAGTSVLVFRLGVERYAIELHDLAEIIANPKCTLVPGAPPELAGVINFRGEIRPVWDLARLMKLPEGENRGPGCLLLLRRHDHEIGLRADRAEQIRSLGAQEWRPVVQSSPYIKGLTEDSIPVLRTEALFKEDVTR